MTPRQLFAMSHPLSRAAGLDTRPYQYARKHPAGLLIMTILAVDR
jgi:hypothetical protein